MTALSNVSLIGSCRLQDLFIRNYPPRLHTAGEVLFFLKNLEKLKKGMLKFNSSCNEEEPNSDKLQDEYRFLCTIHGDCVHKLIRKDTVRFWEKPDLFFRSNIFLMEVSSLSYLRSKYGIGSVFYNQRYMVLDEKNSLIVETTLPELKRQILEIYAILQNIAGHSQVIKLFLIPICDLPLNLGGARIPQRKNISDSLRVACQELRNIEFCPIWDDLRSISEINLSTTMIDRYHYAQDLLGFMGGYLECYFQEKLGKGAKSEVEFCTNTNISQDLFCAYEDFLGRKLL